MRWTTRLAALAFALIGAGLLLQPDRFQRTPSYGNLIRLFPAAVWGVAYLAVAGMLLSWWLWRRPAWWGVAVHTIAIMLTLGWESAFVVRWLTDDATTIVNVASWAVFLIILIESAGLIYDEQEKPVL